MAAANNGNDKELVLRLRDESTRGVAFDEMMRTFGEKIYWQIRKMVVNHEDASDLLQNTFLKAWKNLNNFRGDAKLSTWLYKIAVNESINFLAKERNRIGTSGTEDGDDFLVRNLEADEYFDGDAVQLELQKVIASLPEKQRIVFNMRYFDDMKYEQISEIMGTTVGALKASYHHAVKKIEQHFSKF